MHQDLIGEIKQLLPEYRLIQNEDLRRQVISLWTDTATRTGWAGKLIKVPLGLDWPIEQYGSIIEHTRAVTQGVKALNDTLVMIYSISIDHDSLLAAALIHDLGKLDEFKLDNDNVVTLIDKGPGYHLKLGGKIAKVGGMSSAVCHIIETHSVLYSEKNPESTEAAILRFVDGACVVPLRFH